MTLSVYAVLLVVAVLIGARLDRLVGMNHTRTQLLMSLISGVLLGIAIFHLLPHAVYVAHAERGESSIDYVAPFVMLGLLFMFFLQRLFHFHHHDVELDHVDMHVEHDAASGSSLSGAGFGVILGLVLHSIVDGIALASSMQSDLSMGVAGLAGFSVFFAIMLHKPLDALTLSFFMQQRGISAANQWLLLIVYALICPLVVAALLLVIGSLGLVTPSHMAAALGFSCGVFLCVALSDLLPEVHFHQHDKGKMAVMLLLGVGLSQLITVFEPAHRHQSHDQAQEAVHDAHSLVQPPEHHSDHKHDH